MFLKHKNTHSIDTAELAIIYARDLMLPIEAIKLTADTLEVLLLFQTITHLSALPVVDEHNDYVGIISRRNYLNLMGNNCASELFCHNNLSGLLKNYPDLFSTPLVVRESDRIDQIMVDFLSHDPDIIFEALPVMGNKGLTGIIKIANMIFKLCSAQHALIDSIQQSEHRLEQEIANAASLQNQLLRPEHIDLPGLRGLSTTITASEIGGDFYDYYVVDGHWVIMLVGDVTGHGVAAGTMVSAVKASVNLLECEKEKEPAKILARLSDTFIKTAHQSLLMTMFVAALDTQTGMLRYANAGHQFPYIYRVITERLEKIELGGLPLGKALDIVYEEKTTEIDVGDRLFIYTDGLIEEENPQGECFGYDRLEELLNLYMGGNAETLRDCLLESLGSFMGQNNLTDDITLFFVEHYERKRKNSNEVDSYLQDFELVRISDDFYRAHPYVISSHIARQNIAFLAESDFSDLIPELSAQGIRRILVRHHPINQQLGWNNLLKQHQYRHRDDLAMFLREPRQHWEFQLTHSDDKIFLLEEVHAWLQGLGLLNKDRVDAVILLLDELIENGLYAAPRDGKNDPLYAKGTTRALAVTEILILSLSIQEDILGISLTDNWGTLTPCVFLDRLSRHVQGHGMDAGVGGGGLYFMWKMSDYLQLRVFPHQQTQVCVFLNLKTTFEPETVKGFQFFYHTEIHEESHHE